MPSYQLNRSVTKEFTEKNSIKRYRIEFQLLKGVLELNDASNTPK